MKKSFLIFLSVTAFLVGEALLLHFKTVAEPTTEMTEQDTTTTLSIPGPQPKQEPIAKPGTPEPIQAEQTAPSRTVRQNVVPFTVQAPGGKWDNPIFQDGCEESSMLMAMGFVNGTTSITATDAADGITTLATFEKKRFGYHEDIDLSEIMSVFREYFRYDGVMVKNNLTADDIKRTLASGSIILAPTFGGALGNPFFTPPGPITHMLVLTGYDPMTGEFIVNDPGTRRGEGYRYREQILFDAIWAYPPGKTHPPVPEKSSRNKSVIIVSPKN